MFALLKGIYTSGLPVYNTELVGQFTPTYEAVKIGSDVIGNIAIPAGLAIGLVVWLGIFVALATVAVRSTAESV